MHLRRALAGWVLLGLVASLSAWRASENEFIRSLLGIARELSAEEWWYRRANQRRQWEVLGLPTLLGAMAYLAVLMRHRMRSAPGRTPDVVDGRTVAWGDACAWLVVLTAPLTWWLGMRLEGLRVTDAAPLAYKVWSVMDAVLFVAGLLLVTAAVGLAGAWPRRAPTARVWLALGGAAAAASCIARALQAHTELADGTFDLPRGLSVSAWVARNPFVLGLVSPALTAGCCARTWWLLGWVRAADAGQPSEVLDAQRGAWNEIWIAGTLVVSALLLVQGGAGIVARLEWDPAGWAGWAPVWLVLGALGLVSGIGAVLARRWRVAHPARAVAAIAWGGVALMAAAVVGALLVTNPAGSIRLADVPWAVHAVLPVALLAWLALRIALRWDAGQPAPAAV